MEEVKKFNETKPATFRFTDDDVQKFKELASNLNLSQSEMFGGLLNTFEIDKAKQSIPDRAKEIETFQATAEKLKSMFLNSLEINQTSEERIREDLSLELKTKDQAIADLQGFKADAKNRLKDLADQAQIDAEKVVELEKAVKDFENTIEVKVAEALDREQQIKTLTDQLNYQSDDLTRYKAENIDSVAKTKALEVEAAADRLASQEFKAEIEKLKNELMIQTKQKEFYEAEVKVLKNDHKLQLQKLEDSIEKKDEEIKALRNDQKHEISSLKSEIKAEKDEAVRNALELKTAEFDLIKQKLEYELKQVQDEKKRIQTQISKKES